MTARSEAIERCARKLVEQCSSGRETYRGYGRQFICEVEQAWVTSLADALAATEVGACPDCADGTMTLEFSHPHKIPCPTCHGTAKKSGGGK